MPGACSMLDTVSAARDGREEGGAHPGGQAGGPQLGAGALF